MVKHVPKGQVNKKRVSFGRLEKVIKQMDEKYSIRVGLLGANGAKKVEDTDLDMAALGAVHEFGATIQHKDSTTIIPTRSFLRMPLLSSKGKQEVIKEVVKTLNIDSALKTDKNTPTEFQGVYEREIINTISPKTLATAIGAKAYERVMKAFETDGFGNWEPTKPESRKQRKGSPDNPTLVDTGDMRDSITFEIKKVS